MSFYTSPPKRAPLDMQQTMNGLKYICDADQPAPDKGGFHDAARHTAESALFYIRRLRKRTKHLTTNTKLTTPKDVVE